jgi:ABC-2 type transport system permease protein
MSEITGRKSRYIDFALPGQIGFSLLSTAIFGTVFGLIFLKKSLVLKRMFSTPTHPLTILIAQGASRLILAMMQTVLILAVGILVFKFYLPHGFITLIELLVISVFGLVAFLGFGYFMAGLANDENSAGPLVNLVTLPQFLLSGTFFPTESLPTWLQPIAQNLPLSYFNTAVRMVTTEGQTLIQALPYMGGLLVWGVIMYLLAAKTFKWV